MKHFLWDPCLCSSSSPQVVMSQRLGSSLRRKVGETETQLLALHEAKLAAISGNFSLVSTNLHPCYITLPLFTPFTRFTHH